MPTWVNRGARRRHLDAACRGLDLAREMGAEFEVPEDRVVELPDDTPADVLEAVEKFTVPCKPCVPGARAAGRLVPFYFVDEGMEEEDENV